MTPHLVSSWVRVDGRPMHARVSAGPAPGTTTPIVLVHGLGVASPYLVPLAERLAAHHRVLVPDLPGFGRSPGPRRALDVPGLAEALQAWMYAAGLGRATLIGQSLGCQIVVDFTVRYHRRVERVVLQGLTVDPDGRSAARQMLRLLRDGRHERQALMRVIAADYLRAGLPRVLRTARFMLADPVEDKLPHVRVPALVVRGSRDAIMPQQWAERAAGLLPQGELKVVQGAAHTMNYSHPLEMARVISPFLVASA